LSTVTSSSLKPHRRFSLPHSLSRVVHSTERSARPAVTMPADALAEVELVEDNKNNNDEVNIYEDVDEDNVDEDTIDEDNVPVEYTTTKDSTNEDDSSNDSDDHDKENQEDNDESTETTAYTQDEDENIIEDGPEHQARVSRLGMDVTRYLGSTVYPSGGMNEFLLSNAIATVNFRKTIGPPGAFIKVEDIAIDKYGRIRRARPDPASKETDDPTFTDYTEAFTHAVEDHDRRFVANRREAAMLCMKEYMNRAAPAGQGNVTGFSYIAGLHGKGLTRVVKPMVTVHFDDTNLPRVLHECDRAIDDIDDKLSVAFESWDKHKGHQQDISTEDWEKLMRDCNAAFAISTEFGSGTWLSLMQRLAFFNVEGMNKRFKAAQDFIDTVDMIREEVSKLIMWLRI
jgi:hypothetical protein